ncbi:MAG: helix-turn-helix domain-containing protein [Lachnospiraceae bacterium]
MKASRQSISEVAFSCGFQDMSYFSKVFKAYYSMTPTAYKVKFM